MSQCEITQASVLEVGAQRLSSHQENQIKVNDPCMALDITQSPINMIIYSSWNHGNHLLHQDRLIVKVNINPPPPGLSPTDIIRQPLPTREYPGVAWPHPIS